MRTRAISKGLIPVLAVALVLPAWGIQKQAESQTGAGQTEIQQDQATQETPTTYSLPPEKYEKAVAYAREQNRLFFIGAGWGVAVLLLVLLAGLHWRYRSWAEGVFSNSFLQAIVFVPLMIVTLDILELPTALYGQWLSVQYEQSVQGWDSWAWDWAKGELIGLAIAVPIVWLLYFVIRRSPRRWWLYFWLASLPIIVLLIWLVPVVVQPLFFEFKPLQGSQPQLVENIEALVSRAGLEIPRERMFEMVASEKTNQVNAYVTGFGDTKRVVFYDTTLKRMSEGQALYVFGHEMGHYVLNHLYQGLAVTAALVLVFLLAAHLLSGWYVRRWGERLRIRSVGDWASFPVLILILAVLSFLVAPLSNAWSRSREHEADIYGLEVLHGVVPEANRRAAEAFQILGEINLADPNPSELIKHFRYTHPPLRERVEFVSEYDPWSKGEEPQFVK